MSQPYFEAPPLRPNISDSLSRTWKAVKANIWLFAGFTVMFYGAYYIASFLIGAIIPFASLGIGLLSFIYPVSVYSALQAADGGVEIQLRDFLTWTPKFGHLLAGSAVLYALTMVIFIPVIVLGVMFTLDYQSGDPGFDAGSPVLISLGALLLLVVALALAVFSFALHFLLLKRDLSLGETMSLSWKTGWKHIGQVLLWCLLVLGLIILGVLACGLGLLVTLPVIFGTQYFFLLALYPDVPQQIWDIDQPGPEPPSHRY